jgi:hypothetical protein
MKNFTKQVSALNPADIPMVDTHFGMWMLDQVKLSSRQMVTIPLYLATLGYEKGRDVIDSETIRLLGHIHSQHWFKRMKARPVSHPIGYYSLVDTGD